MRSLTTVDDMYQASLKACAEYLRTRYPAEKLVERDVEAIVAELFDSGAPNELRLRDYQVLNRGQSLSTPLELLVFVEPDRSDFSGVTALDVRLDGPETGVFGNQQLERFWSTTSIRGPAFLIGPPFTVEHPVDKIIEDLKALLRSRYEAAVQRFALSRREVAQLVVAAQDAVVARDSAVREAIARTRLKIVESPANSRFDVTKIKRRRVLGPAIGRDYAITDAEFDAIVAKLRDIGVHFERAPGAYSRLCENHLRDIAVVVLNSAFEWAATAETFNGIGKTDILIQAPGQEGGLFVAELKKWRGVSRYAGPDSKAALAQLFGYLTWREGRACLVHFVDRVSFREAVQQATAATQADATFIAGTLVSRGQDWFETSHQHPAGAGPVRVAHLFVNLHFEAAESDPE